MSEKQDAEASVSLNLEESGVLCHMQRMRELYLKLATANDKLRGITSEVTNESKDRGRGWPLRSEWSMRMNVREELGDLVQHFAWAVFGQECDCGHNPFNRLARWSAGRAWLSCYDDDLNALNWQTAAVFWLGSQLSDLSLWIYTPPFGEPEKENT